jgi:U4/U6 small nuclear ribonucleoprotein PRP3
VQKQKKLRHQAHMAREKERQELARQGLLEPPKKQVKISTFLRVMDEQAVQDPSALEKQVRHEQQEGELAHADRKVARKLTPSER